MASVVVPLSAEDKARLQSRLKEVAEANNVPPHEAPTLDDVAVGVTGAVDATYTEVEFV